MKKQYNRPTADESSHKGYIPYPEDLKVHQAFAELENRNKDTFEFDKEALEDKVEIPSEFSASEVRTPEDLNRRNISNDSFSEFKAPKYGE